MTALERLKAAAEHVNPAVRMQRRLEALESQGGLGIKDLLLMKGEIEKAAKYGQVEIVAVSASRRDLEKCNAVASSKVPTGF